MNASIAIQILPKVESTEEVVRVVDCVIDYIKDTGLTYHVGAFETSVEGDFDQLMDIVKQAHLIAISEGANKVSAYVKTSLSPNGDLLTIEQKTKKHEH